MGQLHCTLFHLWQAYNALSGDHVERSSREYVSNSIAQSEVLCRYSASHDRTCKPFNPLLGETYELVDKERKFRFLAEKVVHHPTVLAAHCEGCGWTLDGDLEVKSKFWGRCIELKPFGKLEVCCCKS